MKARTLVLLALLVGLFLALRLLRRQEQEQQSQAAVQELLCPGFAKERIARVRVDHLERGIQVGLERDARGSWFLTDPVAYPAQDELVRTQLDVIERALGERVPEADPRELGLDPPRIVVELEQVQDSGERTVRVEIGKVDLDPSHVYVRVPPADAARGGGGVLRTLRTLYTTFDRNPDDYRSRRVTNLDPRDVLRIVRRGTLIDRERGGVVDLALEAVREPEGWICRTPPIVRLDPIGMGLIARGSAELDVEAFTDDAPRSYAPYGLDPPRFTLELQDQAGAMVALDFGTPDVVGPTLSDEEDWFARRQGFPHVFAIEARTARLLSVPTDLLFDTLFLRARSDDVVALELTAGTRVLYLERDADGWSVSSVAAGEERPASSFRADPARVQDVLSVLEHLQVTYPPELLFVPREEPLAINVRTQDGLVFGGRIGAAWRDTALGTAGYGYLRLGDERAGWIGEQALDVARSTLERFRSLEIHTVRETEAGRLVLRRGDAEHTYVSTKPLEWVVAGTSLPAPRSLTNALEVLLGLEAERWLDGVPASALADPLEVCVTLPDRELVFRLARGPDRELLCEEGGHVAEVSRRALETFRDSWQQDLLDGLLELFPR